jgi:outer membrane protein OmpA-like peptidoglycan-associated protein
MHTYNSDGSPKGPGFSMTTKTANGWSVPVDLKVINYYNRAGANEFCFSADRKVLLMSIRRDETFGENDIYASFLQENGEFSEPKNLGNTVNTFAWESSPFLAPDGVTLYYSTAGYPGFGNADIFMTRRLDSTWTNWSTPLNMGPDINSSNWEAYYSVAASGKYAYVVSEQNGIEGSLDIFQVKLPEVLKPKPVVLIYGKVLNSKTKEPLESNINYNILATNKEMGIASSGVKDGSYKIVLPAGEVYSFLAKKNGFYSVSENIDVSKITAYKELERDLYLAPLEVGGTIRLNNLFFDFNKSSLRKESYPELDRVIKLLNENLQMEIEISGHTDNVGSDEINNKLSQDRSMSVKAYILSKGIASERIISKGYGKTKPVADNVSEEGRQKNRRVEFTILKK